MNYPDYPLELQAIDCGVPFEMLNYEHLYIRVRSKSNFGTVYPNRMTNPVPFNGDYHLAIVRLSDGVLIFMWKGKPCRMPCPKCRSVDPRREFGPRSMLGER